MYSKDQHIAGLETRMQVRECIDGRCCNSSHTAGIPLVCARAILRYTLICRIRAYFCYARVPSPLPSSLL